MSDGIRRAFRDFGIRRSFLSAVEVTCARAERLHIETLPVLREILSKAGAPGPEAVRVVRGRHITPVRDFH